MAVEGLYGNSEDFIENDNLEPSPDNSEQEPGQEGDDSLGAGPEKQGEPEESQAEQPENKPGDQPQELILGKFKSYEDLAEAYKNLERRLGQQSQQNNLQMAQLLQAMMGGVQPPGTVPGGQQAPYPAQGTWWGANPSMPQDQGVPWMAPGTTAPGVTWMPPGVTTPQPQPSTPQSSQAADEEVDPNKWLDEFYEKGPKAVDARVEARARKIVEEMLNQASQQYIAPLAQSMQVILGFVQSEATRRAFAQMAQEAAKGKDDFNDLRQEMEAVIKEQPHILLMAQFGQNPYEIAYQEAKRRKAQDQQQQQIEAAQKKGAQMPRPTAASRREPQPQDPEKAYVRALFGLDGSGRSTQGIFGQIE